MAKGSGNTRQSSVGAKVKTGITLRRGLRYKEIEDKIIRVSNIVIANGGMTREGQVKPFQIGRISSELKSYAKDIGIDLQSDKIYLTSKGISHTLRPEKLQKGINITIQELATFPRRMRDMNVTFNGGDFVYFDNVAKYVVTPNYKIKLPNGKVSVANYITATRLGKGEYDNLIKEKIKVQR